MTAAVTRTTTLTVVSSPACHFCDDADRALRLLAEQFAFAVARVALDSPEGRRLVEEHRPSMTPLVLVDGEFFSSGWMSRRKLAARLTATGAARPERSR
jgi:alkyl hydroperoxide reductase subunit AhpF